MASIQKHGEKWRAQVDKRGVRKSAIWPTKRQAEQWATRVEAEILAGQVGSTGGHTFGQAVRHYEETVSSRKRGEEWELLRLGAMLRYFGADLPLADIDSKTISKWRDDRLKGTADAKAVSPSTVVREANLLRNLFTRARDEWRWMEQDPFRGVHLPKEGAPRHQTWGWKNIRRVIRHGQRGGQKSQEVVKAFHIALRTGMRLAETLASPEGWNPRRRVVTLDQTKTTGRVEIPITRLAARVMTSTPFTVGPNEASVLFSKMCRELLIQDLTFHDSRATALTLLARKVDVMTLARISRHRDLKILLNTYYRESAEQIAARI